MVLDCWTMAKWYCMWSADYEWPYKARDVFGIVLMLYKNREIQWRLILISMGKYT